MQDKIAIITGASRGLGRSMAAHLAREGVGILGTYRTNQDMAGKLIADIESRGGTAAMLHLDIGRTDAFPAFGAAVEETLAATFGRGDFDFLVNNAGDSVYAPFAETTEAQFDEVFDQHVKGPYFLSQALLPLIVDGGRILNISSGLARFTNPGFSAYASSKGAMEVLTRYMALELGDRGVRVNVVAPGAIATDFSGGLVRDNPEVNAAIAAATALGRVGEADDIGAGVAAVLSDRFSWASGTRIELSGGQNL